MRDKQLNLADEQRQLLVEAQSCYSFITAAELNEGLEAMQADAAAHGPDWIDARPTHFIAAQRP